MLVLARARSCSLVLALTDGVSHARTRSCLLAGPSWIGWPAVTEGSGLELGFLPLCASRPRLAPVWHASLPRALAFSRASRSPTRRRRSRPPPHARAFATPSLTPAASRSRLRHAVAHARRLAPPLLASHLDSCPSPGTSSPTPAHSRPLPPTPAHARPLPPAPPPAPALSRLVRGDGGGVVPCMQGSGADGGGLRSAHLPIRSGCRWRGSEH